MTCKGFLVIEKVECIIPVVKQVGGDAFLQRRKLKH